MGANAAAGQEPLVVSIDIRLNRMCPTIRWSTSANIFELDHSLAPAFTYST
jgi:hypothetical protein